jgi:hypothetical protein
VNKCKHEGGCEKNDQGGGFCKAHGGGYRCKVEGCGKFAKTRGLCIAHHKEREKQGADPGGMVQATQQVDSMGFAAPQMPMAPVDDGPVPVQPLSQESTHQAEGSLALSERGMIM